MKKIIPILGAFFLMLSCSEDHSSSLTESVPDSQELYSIKEINSFIEKQLRINGDVDWKSAETKMLYSAVMLGGEVVSIGYGQEGESFSSGQKSPELKKALQNINNIIERNEGVKKASGQTGDDILNVVDVTITSQETIAELQDADQIRYLDPIGYNQFRASNAGTQLKSAGCNQESDNLNRNDFSVISPNALLPWNYQIHNIPDAWNISTGSGITIGIIDTGISPNQSLLNSEFNDGFFQWKKGLSVLEHILIPHGGGLITWTDQMIVVDMVRKCPE